MKNILIAGAALAALACGSSAMAAVPTLTGVPGQTTPSLLITIGAGGVATITSTATCGQASCPYDNAEDTYISVLNNSSSVINSLNLSAAAGTDIFGFDGDGISLYGGGSNAQDNSGYGGSDSYFTGINAGLNIGVVNFIGGIAANGGTGFFSLEEPLSVATFTQGGGGISTGGVPEPSSWALMLTGFAGLGAVLRRRRAGAVAFG